MWHIRCTPETLISWLWYLNICGLRLPGCAFHRIAYASRPGAGLGSHGNTAFAAVVPYRMSNMCYRTVLKCNISETAIKNKLCILIFCKAPVKSKILNIFMILWHITMITNELWELYLSIILMSVTCKVFDIRCNDHACAGGQELGSSSTLRQALCTISKLFVSSN